MRRSLSLLFARLASALVDNAVAHKDALLFARHRGALWGLGGVLVVALLTTGFVAALVQEAVDAVLYAPELSSHGRTLTAAVTVVALALSSLLIPPLASTSLSGERESGTLRLLQTTALTPADIVAGKLLALLYASALPLLVAVPLLAGGALLSAVSLVDVLYCCALLGANVVALTSVGVAVSAVSERSRSAAARALGTAALLVWLPVGIPSVALVVLWAAGGYRPEMLSAGAFVATWSALLSAGSFLLARDALAPASAPQRRSRRPLVVAALAGGPVIAALSLVGLRSPVDVEAWSSLYLGAWGLLLLTVTIVDVALTEPRRCIWGAAARCALLASLGLLLAAPIAMVTLDGHVSGSGARAEALAQPIFGSLLVAALWIALAAVLGAVVSRRLESPLRRVVVTLLALAGLWFVPAFLSNVPLLRGWLPLVDPCSLIYVVTGGMVQPYDTPWGDGPLTSVTSVGLLLVVWVAVLGSLLALAKLEARRLGDASATRKVGARR